MAQHDYVIDNSTGANVRADINNALLAISSNNSGSSAPSTTYALQTFANTTTSILQLRNAANNAFVNLRGFDGTLQLPDGSESSLAVFFDDDTNTGFYSSADDKINFVTGGTERLELGTTTIFNESGADVDFRIEGDSVVNMFYVDAGNNRVGFGTDSPTDFVHMSTSNSTVLVLETSSSSDTGVELVLFQNSSSPADNDLIGRITFKGDDDAGNATDFVSVRATSTDVSNGSEDGEFTVLTQTAGSLSEKFRIDDSGIRLQNLSDGGGLVINQLTTTGQHGSIVFNSNRTGDFDILGFIRADYNSDSVASIDLLGGNDTANKDNGKISLKTQPDNSSGLLHRMLINEDGQVLIGSTSNAFAPGTNERLIVFGNANNNSRIAIVAQHNDDNPAKLDIAKSRGSGNVILGTNDDVGTVDFSGNDGNGYHVMGRIMCSCVGSGNSSDNLPADLRFFTLEASTTTVAERCRINSAGKFLVGTTSGANFSNNVAEFLNTTADGAVGVRSTMGASQQDFITFKFGGGPTACGGIRRDGTTQGVELFSNSDRRIKTNILDMDNTLDKINQLSLKKFDFKDGSGSGIGLIAQDLISIFPSKVKKDASDDGTGDTVPDGVDAWTVGHNFTYELLKAIQELTARVAALEAA